MTTALNASKHVRASQWAALTRICTLVILLSTFAQTAVLAAPSREFELSNEEYVSKAFSAENIGPKRIWIRGELRDQLEKILGHSVSFIRTKYWAEGLRSVWILEEIGKDKLITVGHTVEHKNGISTLTDVKVLAFRESRGWEVKYPFFTNQFSGVSRKQNRRGLSHSIDGITGATLSVRALKKLAEIALLLDEHVREAEKIKN